MSRVPCVALPYLSWELIYEDVARQNIIPFNSSNWSIKETNEFYNKYI